MIKKPKAKKPVSFLGGKKSKKEKSVVIMHNPTPDEILNLLPVSTIVPTVEAPLGGVVDTETADEDTHFDDADIIIATETPDGEEPLNGELTTETPKEETVKETVKEEEKVVKVKKPRKTSKWQLALQEYKKQTGKYCMPKKGTKEYDEIKAIQATLS